MLRGNENKKWFGKILVVVLCLAVVGVARADWQEQDKLLASDGAANDDFGWSVSISGDYAIVGAPDNDDNGSSSGSTYIFGRIGTNWVQLAKLTASDAAAQDYFGCSVSISGDYAIVGSYYDDDDGAASGSAYIFKRSDISNDPNWYEQVKLTASDAAAQDYFGRSVSISGHYAIVGAWGDDDNGEKSGSAYIFTPNDVDPNNWVQLAKLTALDGAAGDDFGVYVSINGDYSIVAAHGDDDKGDMSGSAYIFTPNEVDPNNWDQQAKLTASDGAADDLFGYSVSISGDYAIVGAHYHDANGVADSGSAYIFKRDGESWTEQAKLTASDGAYNEQFGYSVSISADYAIAGVVQDDGATGSAYIFKRDGESWTQQTKLTASDAAAADLFGYKVSLSSDHAIVGAIYDDDNGNNSGSAYVFEHVCPTADLSGDCFVNFEDFGIMTDQWLQGK